MAFEIERKFLIRGDGWRAMTVARHHIRQAYLASDGKASIRVRIKDGSQATLTVKSRGPQLRRLELEYPIPLLEAQAMMALRGGCIVDKVRHIVPYDGTNWEIDVFEGDNAGLVLAEVELREESQKVELPPWVGAEVTGQSQYYNGSLAQHPFCAWSGTRGISTTR